MSKERRVYNIPLQLRSVAGGKKLVGYAALFNEHSEDLGGFIEVIRPGAFRNTIESSDVRALWNHDDNFVLGRTKSGTLTLTENHRGLRVEITPPDAQWAHDLMASIERGDVDQMSFGFRKKLDQWTSIGGTPLRELLEVDLFDVSPVTWPAYKRTVISVEARARVLFWDTPSGRMQRRQEAVERQTTRPTAPAQAPRPSPAPFSERRRQLQAALEDLDAGLQRINDKRTKTYR